MRGLDGFRISPRTMAWRRPRHLMVDAEAVWTDSWRLAWADVEEIWLNPTHGEAPDKKTQVGFAVDKRAWTEELRRGEPVGFGVPVRVGRDEAPRRNDHDAVRHESADPVVVAVVRAAAGAGAWAASGAGAAVARAGAQGRVGESVGVREDAPASRKSRVAAAVTAAGLVVGLAACSTVPSQDDGTESSSLGLSHAPQEPMHTDDPQQILDTQQELLEEQAPAIAEAIGASRVKFLRQSDCSGEMDPYKMGSKVQWTTTIGHRVPDLDAAVRAGDDLRRYLEQHGWTVHVAESLRPAAPANTLFNAEHFETHMKLTAEYQHGGGDSDLWIRGGGPCVDMPKGNQMVRSHLDNGFGIPQPEYDWEAERRSPDYQEYSLPPGEKPGPVTPTDR